MKRTNAELDALSSSPSPKRRAYESSTDSSHSSYRALPYRESRPPEEDDDGPSSPSVDSSVSNFFQRPVGPDPNDSQELQYDSDADLSVSETASSDSEYSERPVDQFWTEYQKSLIIREEHKRIFGSSPVYTSTNSSSDSGSNPKSFSSTSDSISDDVSEASSSSVSGDNESKRSSSSSSGSSSSSNPASARERSNTSSHSSSTSHASSHSPSTSSPHHSPPSASPSHSPTSRLSTANLSELQSRIQTLLPKLKSANQELEVEKAEGRLGKRDIENVKEEEKEGKGYIEMELGLGVLEQKGKEKDEGKEGGGEGNGDGDVMGRLMGKKGKRQGRGKGKRKMKIEEVGG